jgi:hydrogenase/urease accessory protein HupE
MIAGNLDNWWLAIYLVGAAIMFVALVYAYVLAWRGDRGPLEYTPGVLLIILGLAINITGYLDVLPPRLSKSATWVAFLVAAIGLVFLERKWRKEKKGARRQ